jgi:hypothetical protein
LQSSSSTTTDNTAVAKKSLQPTKRYKVSSGVICRHLSCPHDLGLQCAMQLCHTLFSSQAGNEKLPSMQQGRQTGLNSTSAACP